MRGPIGLIPKVGPGVGLGHLMRCVALAQALQDGGASGIAILLPPRAREGAMVKKEGLETEVLRGGVSLPEESAYVVDLELPQATWPLHFGSRPRALVAIDDGGLRIADADLIVNPNLGASPEWYHGSTALAIGPRFALLRRDFQAARRRSKRIRERARRVVVSLGGSDPLNGTRGIVSALSDLDVRFEVVIGPGFRQSIRRPKGARADFRFHRSPSNTASLFLTADVAITGGGSTLYEVAACGTPTAVLSLNNAQRTHALRWHAVGAAEYAGPAAPLEPDALRACVLGLLRDPARRRALSEKSRRLVDGQGARRVATMLFRTMSHSHGNIR